MTNAAHPLTLFGEEGSLLLYVFSPSPAYYPAASHYNTREALRFLCELILAPLQVS